MQRPMRSKLFVPGSRPELFAKAAASVADAFSFDLEDAVAAGSESRGSGLSGCVAERPPHRPMGIVVVRANGLSSGLFEDDLQVIVGTGLDVLNLPMAESGEEVREAASALRQFKATAGIERPIGILANIETPKGFRTGRRHSDGKPAHCRLQIGYADLSNRAASAASISLRLNHVRLVVRFAAARPRFLLTTAPSRS